MVGQKKWTSLKIWLIQYNFHSGTEKCVQLLRVILSKNFQMLFCHEVTEVDVCYNIKLLKIVLKDLFCI